MTETLYHGSHKGVMALHLGLCLTESDRVAEHYAGMSGSVTTVELDWTDLVIEACEGYDHDTNSCPADDEDYQAAARDRGVDVLVYEDEDEHGAQHECYRLVSARALAAITTEED